MQRFTTVSSPAYDLQTIKTTKTDLWLLLCAQCSSMSRFARLGALSSKPKPCLPLTKQASLFSLIADMVNVGCTRGKFVSPHQQQKQQHQSNDYDTGIGSTTTLMSPVGSPQPVCRSHVKTNGHFSSYMQVGATVIYLLLIVELTKNKNYRRSLVLIMFL